MEKEVHCDKSAMEEEIHHSEANRSIGSNVVVKQNIKDIVADKCSDTVCRDLFGTNQKFCRDCSIIDILHQWLSFIIP